MQMDTVAATNAGSEHSPGGGDPKREAITGSMSIEAIEAGSPEHVLQGDSIYACLSASASATPDKTALILLTAGETHAQSREITYSDYLKQVTAAANCFARAAAGRPSVVASMLPILPEALFVAWGGATGGIVNPINPHLEIELIVSILNTVQATVLVTTQSYGPSAADQVDSIAARVPSLQRVLLVDSDDPARDFAAALAHEPSDRLTFEPSADPAAPSTYLPTGGTTAAPKLARLNHHGQLLNAWIGGAVMGSRDDEVIGLGMPLFHVGGLIMLALRAAILGQTALLLTPEGFRNRGIVQNFWNIAKRFGVTSLIATPTTAAALVDAGGEEWRGNSIRTFTCGGSTIPVELGKTFSRMFEIDLREVWGSTEFHGFLACQPQILDPVIGSVGIRTPWHDVKAIVVSESNAYIGEVEAGEQGVIVGRGPCLCSGYADPSLDSELFVSGMPDGERWGTTGDIGRVDASGYVWIDGRAKDVIIRGGHNIDPRMIENVLLQHPAVLLAAAVGMPDGQKGEVPVAYVELMAGRTAECEELMQLCRRLVQERAACPKDIVILPKMPLTAVGKIFKPELRADAVRRAVERAAGAVLGDRPFKIDLPPSRGRPIVALSCAGLSPETEAQLAEALGKFSFTFQVATDPA